MESIKLTDSFDVIDKEGNVKNIKEWVYLIYEKPNGKYYEGKKAFGSADGKDINYDEENALYIMDDISYTRID